MSLLISLLKGDIFLLLDVNSVMWFLWGLFMTLMTSSSGLAYHRQGDVNLGVLSSLHGGGGRNDKCGTKIVHPRRMQYMEVIRYTIDEINNNQTILPQVNKEKTKIVIMPPPYAYKIAVQFYWSNAKILGKFALSGLWDNSSGTVKPTTDST